MREPIEKLIQNQKDVLGASKETLPTEQPPVVISKDQFANMDKSKLVKVPKQVAPVVISKEDFAKMDKKNLVKVPPVTGNESLNAMMQPELKPLKPVDHKFLDGLNNDEDNYLAKGVEQRGWTPEELDYATKTMKRTFSGTNQYGKSPMYWLDESNKGLPVSVDDKPAPKGVHVESIWGMKDNKGGFFENLVKNVYNKVVEAPAMLSGAAATIEGAVTGEEGYFNELNNSWKQAAQSLSLPKHEVKSFIESINEGQYLPTTEQLGDNIGSIIGTILQFRMGGNAFAGIKTESAIASGIKNVAGMGLLMSGSAYEEAKNQGLDNRSAGMVGLASGIGSALLFEKFGNVLGGVFKGFKDEGGDKLIANSVINTLKKYGNEITPESTEAMIKDAMVKTSDASTGYLKSLPKEILKNVGAMEAVDLYDKGVKTFYDKVGGDPKFGDQFKDDFWQGVLNNAKEGVLFGLVPHPKESRLEREDQKDLTVLDYVKQGKGVELKNNLENLYQKGAITHAELLRTGNIIDGYQRLNSEIADVPVDDKSKVDIMNNAMKSEALKGQIEAIKEDPAITSDAIREGKIKALESQKKVFDSAIVDLIAGNKKEKEVKKEVKEEAKVAEPEIQEVRDQAKEVEKQEEGAQEFEQKFKSIAKEEKPISFTKLLPTNKKIVEIHHGEDLRDKNNQVGGVGETPLMPQVTKEAKDVKGHLEKEGLKDIHVSSVQRAVDTAKKIGGEFNYKENKAFDAWDIGDTKTGFEGMDREEFKPIEEYFQDHPNETTLPADKFPGMEGKKLNESWGQLVERLVKAHNDIVSNPETPETVGILTHSKNMKILDAMRNNGGEWNEKAKQEYRKDKVESTEVRIHGKKEEAKQEPEKIQPKISKEKIKSDRSRMLSREPRSIQEAVHQYFLGGGRIKTKDLLRELGIKTNSKEFRKLIWAHKKDSPPLDTIASIIAESMNRELDGDFEDEVRNAIIDTLMTHNKTSMLHEMLQAERKENMGDYANLSDEEMADLMKARDEQERLENEALLGLAEKDAQKAIDFDYSEIPDEVLSLSDEELQREFEESEKYFAENGEIDYDLIQKKNEEGVNQKGEAGAGNKVPNRTEGSEATESEAERTEKRIKDVAEKYVTTGITEAADEEFYQANKEAVDREAQRLGTKEKHRITHKKLLNFLREFPNEHPKGFISRMPGASTGYKFTDKSGNTLDFYFHHTNKELTQPKVTPQMNAELHYLPDYEFTDERTGEEIKKDVIQVVQDGKPIGYVRETDKFLEGDEAKLVQLEKEKKVFEEAYAKSTLKSRRERLKAEISDLQDKINEIRKNLGAGEIKYQKKSIGESLASIDPGLEKAIRGRLAELFPRISVFEKAEDFQDYIDRNFPGKKLDLDALGASIGHAVYINPESAVQSTAIHEYAHHYWDMLPKNDKVKLDLEKIAGGEEEAVSLIGKQGLEIAKAKFGGKMLSNVISKIKSFWAQVKNVIGIATDKDLARIVANRLWSQKANLDAVYEGASVVKYMKDFDRINKLVKNIIRSNQDVRFDAESNSYEVEKKNAKNEVVDVVRIEPVNKILSSQEEFADNRSEEVKKNDVIIGSAINSFNEGITNVPDKEKAIALLREELKNNGIEASDDVINNFHDQLTARLNDINKDGSAIAGQKVISGYDKLGTVADHLVIDKSGKAKLYSIKVHQGELIQEEKAKSGVELAITEALLKKSDDLTARSGLDINESGVISVKYTLDGNKLVSVEVGEPITDFGIYAKQYAADIIDEAHEQSVKADKKEFISSDKYSLNNYAKLSKFPYEEKQKELDAYSKRKDLTEQEKNDYAIAKADMREFLNEYKKYQEEFDEMQRISKIDVSSWSDRELRFMHMKLNAYDNLAANSYLRKVIEEINRRTSDGIKPSQDIGALNKWLLAPTVLVNPEHHPVVANVIRKVQRANQMTENDVIFIRKTMDKAMKDLIEEKKKSMTAGQKIGRKVSGLFYDDSQLFENMFDKDGKLKPIEKLTGAEKAFMQTANKLMEAYNVDTKEAAWTRAIPGFWETYHNSGLFQSVANSFASNMQLDFIKLVNWVDPSGKNHPEITFGEAKDIIASDYAKTKSSVKKGVLLTRLKFLTNRAKKSVDNNIHETGEEFDVKPGQATYRFTASGPLRGLYAGGFKVEKSGKLGMRPESDIEKFSPSRNLYWAVVRELSDRSHIRNFNPVMSDVIATKVMYDNNKNGQLKNITKFYNSFYKQYVTKEGLKSDIGPTADKAFDFMRAWSFYNTMTFNIPLGIGNIVQGKFAAFINDNTFADKEGRGFVEGEKRFWGNWKKATSILNKYGAFNIEMGEEHGADKNIWQTLSDVSTAAIKYGEYYIQGTMFLANMTKKQWDAYDNNGNVIDNANKLSTNDIINLKNIKDAAQGYYDSKNKGLYSSLALGRSLMQYRTWMVSFIKSRVGKRGLDVYGKEMKGRYWSLAKFHEAFTKGKDWWNSNDIDAVNNRKNLRELGVLMMLGTMYLMLDNKKKKQNPVAKFALKSMQDMGLMFNMDNYKWVAQNPVPSSKVLMDFLTAVQYTTQAVVGKGKYKTDSQFGAKGDYKFPGAFLKILPYKNILKGLGTDTYQDNPKKTMLHKLTH